MTASYTATIRERVQHIETMPAIPAVWKDTLERLQKSDPELFQYRPKTAAAAD